MFAALVAGEGIEAAGDAREVARGDHPRELATSEASSDQFP